MKNFFNEELLKVVRACPYDFVPKHEKKIRAWLKKHSTKRVRSFFQYNFAVEAPLFKSWKDRTRGIVLADVERSRKGLDITLYSAAMSTEDSRLKQVKANGYTYFLCPFCSKRVFAHTVTCVFCDQALAIPLVNNSKAYADYIKAIGASELTASDFEIANEDLDKYIPVKRAASADVPDDLYDTIELDPMFEIKSKNMANAITQKSFKSKPMFVINAIAKMFRMQRIDRQGELYMPITAGIRLLYAGPQVAMEFISGSPHKLKLYTTSDEAMSRAMSKLYNTNIVTDIV